jgi:hypothetical protein
MQTSSYKDRFKNKLNDLVEESSKVLGDVPSKSSRISNVIPEMPEKIEELENELEAVKKERD